MSVDREAIYAALYARLPSTPTFVTKSRILRAWFDTPAEEQPAIYQAQTGQIVIPTSGQPAKWVLKADLYIYSKVPAGVSPGTVLNALLAEIELALKSDHPIDSRCTLGGLVHYARIEGEVETDEGTLGDQAVAIVPIAILTTDQ